MINRRQSPAGTPSPHNMHRDEPRAQNANSLPSGKPRVRNRKDQDARALNLNSARPSSPSYSCGVRSPNCAWKHRQRHHHRGDTATEPTATKAPLERQADLPGSSRARPLVQPDFTPSKTEPQPGDASEAPLETAGRQLGRCSRARCYLQPLRVEYRLREPEPEQGSGGRVGGAAPSADLRISVQFVFTGCLSDFCRDEASVASVLQRSFSTDATASVQVSRKPPAMIGTT
jgi:hypothetical protein